MAEQLERRADKSTKFISGASTSRAGQNNDKGIIPTPKDKEPAVETGAVLKNAKTGVYDPSLSHTKCYRCNEMVHKYNTCPKRRESRLVECRCKEVEEMEQIDSDEDYDDETMLDVGHQLSCLIHRDYHVLCTPDMSQRTNLFCTRGTINGKMCNIIIDNGSTDNLISAQAVKKLELPTEAHPKPYTVVWTRCGDSVKVTQSCRVPHSISKRYKDTVVCDIVEMDATHLLLGRPWQFDVDATHRGRLNQYIIKVDDSKVALVPLPLEASSSSEKPNLLIQPQAAFTRELNLEAQGLTLLVKEVTQSRKVYVPKAVEELLSNFSRITDDVQHSLAPHRSVDHRIDLLPGASLPNLPHYRLSPGEIEIYSHR